MSSAPTPRRRVLITTASVGAGHKQVARALTDRLHAAADRIDLRVEDALDYTPPAFRAFYAGGFELSMSRLPRLFGIGFRLTNHPQRPGLSTRERLRLRGERFCLRKLTEVVLDFRPELIVSTHFLAAPLVQHLSATGRLRCRHVVVVTDIEVHRFWYCPDVDRWFLPAAYSAEPLRRWGVPEEQLTVSGIPVHPRWNDPIDREHVLRQWGLPADRDIVLLSGGAEFTCGPVVRIARAILRRTPATVVALAGRNKKLLARLGRMPEAGTRLMPVAYTDRMPELVEVCSAMVTKAGGITTAECLLKGRPMVLIRPVPGHEGGNADFLAREGAALIGRRPGRIARHVASILSDENRRRRMQAAARRLHQPGTEIVVRNILGMLNIRSGPPGGEPNDS